MSKDHYVAITYLKHFVDSAANGMLNAYSKKNSKQFQCYPKDVCYEINGDANQFFNANTNLLGQFRAIFEPNWNVALEAFLSNRNTDHDKFVVSAYMANLMVVTPSWQRVGAKMYAENMKGTLEFARKLHDKGVKQMDEVLCDGIDLISRGDLSIDVDTDYIKGIATKQLMVYAVLIYHSDWHLLINETSEKFITSDNPVAMQTLGVFSGRVKRYLPLTPELCLMIEFDGHKQKNLNDDEFWSEFQKSPEGKILKLDVKNKEVKAINVMQVKSAENLIFTSIASEKISYITQKYAKYQLDVNYHEFPSSDGNEKYQAMQICVCERA